MPKALVLGASGATGKLLTQLLLERGVQVTAVVRNVSSLTPSPNLAVIEASIWDMPESELRKHLESVDAVFSCLGHNLTFKGMFGKPRRLVTDVIQKCVTTIETLKPERKVKIILMNTSGNRNRDLDEQAPASQTIAIALVRALIPPHCDNEQAAEVLRVQVGQTHEAIEWVAVRPDALVDQENVSAYDLYASPIRNVIFNSGNTSRVNVADLMARLMLEEALWQNWKGKMPVIYNRETS